MFGVNFRKTCQAIAVLLGLVSGAVLGNDFSEINIQIPSDINTSFMGVYVNHALSSKPKQVLFTTADIILNPIPYDTLSSGVTFTPPKVSGNVMKIREQFYSKPFVEFIGIKDGGVAKFDMSEISPDLSGRLIESGDDFNLDSISKTMNEECRNLYTKKFSINDQDVMYFGCSSRNADFFVIVQNDDEKLGQTYMYASEPPKNSSSKDKPNRKIFIINYLARELVNYKNPDTTLSNLVIPEATFNVFLSSSFAKRSPEGQAEDLSESLASDFDILHSRAEDIMKDSLFNRKLLISSRKNKFKQVKINYDTANVSLSLYNVTENYYGNNLMTISDDSQEHVAALTLVTPKLMGTESMQNLAEKIAEDKTCMAPHEITQKETMGLPSIIIDCDNTFGTDEFTKSYLAINVSSLMNNDRHSEAEDRMNDSIMLVMLLGDNTDNEIEDIVNAGLMYNNLRWNPTLSNMTEMEKDYIMTIPNVRMWNNLPEAERNEETWNSFIAEAEKAIAGHQDATPEELLELIKQCSSSLTSNKSK